jgi:hypothetical protein
LVLWLLCLASLIGFVSLLLALANAAYFGRYALRPVTPARRTGAFALALVHAAIAAESLLSLAPARLTTTTPGLATAALLAVRTLLLLALGFIALLAWRARPRLKPRLRSWRR